MAKAYENHDFSYIDKHCIGCHYYAGISDDIYYCSYFVKEDKLRPCPPGKDCTVRINRADYKPKEKKILEKQQKKPEKPVRKNEVLLTYKGETKTIKEWARLVGIDRRTMYYRIKIMGWSVEKALETPTKTTGNGKKKEGVNNA